MACPGQGARYTPTTMFRRSDMAKFANGLFRRSYSRLTSPPQSILFVKKKQDSVVSNAMLSIIKYLKNAHPAARLLYETESAPLDTNNNGLEPWSPPSKEAIDLVIALGGDGTILRASSLFKTGPVPPVLSFSMGTLGFLLPFHIHDFREALRDVFEGRVTVLERMRLACILNDVDGKSLDMPGNAGWQVMNEVTLHRGRSPHMNIIHVFVNGMHLTEAHSDGLIVSTPTGSTAYSLSAGGPIVHPSVQALLLTPICPRSLSFRPLLLPGHSRLTLQVSSTSRAPAEVAMDGQGPSSNPLTLLPGQSVSVQVSPYPIPCINRTPAHPGKGSISDDDDWVKDINTLLQFNATFRNKGILEHTR